jgi:hypothetical protein
MKGYDRLNPTQSIQSNLLIIFTLCTHVEHQNCIADGLPLGTDGPWPGLSVVATLTVRVCEKSVRVPRF